MHVRLEAPVCRAAWLRCCSVLCQRREASRHGAKLQSVFLAGTLKKFDLNVVLLEAGKVLLESCQESLWHFWA